MLNIDLQGRIAVVTGATGELGHIISRTFAQCGADVAIHYHQSAERAQALAGEIRAATRGRACLNSRWPTTRASFDRAWCTMCSWLAPLYPP